jgi:hypothetical protein
MNVQDVFNVSAVNFAVTNMGSLASKRICVRHFTACAPALVRREPVTNMGSLASKRICVRHFTACAPALVRREPV